MEKKTASCSPKLLRRYPFSPRYFKLPKEHHPSTGSMVKSFLAVSSWEGPFLGFKDGGEFTTVAFKHMPYGCGLRVAYFSGGGAGTVLGADACENAGMQMPDFTKQTEKKNKRIGKTLFRENRSHILEKGIPPE